MEVGYLIGSNRSAQPGSELRTCTSRISIGTHVLRLVGYFRLTVLDWPCQFGGVRLEPGIDWLPDGGIRAVSAGAVWIRSIEIRPVQV